MKVLFIGSRLFDDVAWYAQQENITTILTESNENATNLDLADKTYIVPRGMDKPAEIAIKEDVDAVIPLIGIDPPLVDVGQMKDKLWEENNIPVIASGYKTAKLAADKFDTKEVFHENGIKTPDYCSLNKPYDIEEVIDKLPTVLKTPDGQAGRGVQVAVNKEEADEFLEKNMDSNNIFLEQFIKGLEVSIEVLRWKGQSVALSPIYKGDTTFEGTHPLNKIKKAPLNIKDIDNTRHNNGISLLAEQIADLVDMDGTMDIDILYSYSTKEDYVIELNTRPSGTRYMTAATTNIYPLCQLLDMAKGDWSADNVRRDILNYYAVELPIGDFPENKLIPKIKSFNGDNSYIVHAPKHYQRLTMRADSLDNLNNMLYDLVPNYAKRNNIKFVKN